MKAYTSKEENPGIGHRGSNPGVCYREVPDDNFQKLGSIQAHTGAER